MSTIIHTPNVSVIEVINGKAHESVECFRCSQTDQAYTVKCPRCIRRHNITCNYDSLCDRCVDVLMNDHPDHWSVPGIKSNLEVQMSTFGHSSIVNCPHVIDIDSGK